MLKIQTLASGSRGNCTYIASDHANILVDIGLSLAQLGKRLADAQINAESINGIFITHEHGDHVRGVLPFMKKFKNAKLYLHEDACDCFLSKIGRVDSERICTYNAPVDIEDLHVDYFEVCHDSEYCYGYTFKNKDAKISLTTDLGRIDDEILHKMAGSQIVMIESNHDSAKLACNTKYPYWLKKRISSGYGHLSNSACGIACYKLKQLGVEQIILAHLSQDNNSPTLAYNVIKDFLAAKGVIEGEDISIDVATQDCIGRCFCVK